MFGWFKNKIVKSGDYAQKVVGKEEIQKVTEEIKNMSASVLSPKNKIKNARKETFLEAKERLSVSDLDLIKIYHNYAYCFYISMLFVVGLFLAILYKLFILKELFGSFVLLVFLMLSLVYAFKFSFRAFQIKHQKLCSVQEWWTRANEWWPKI